MLYKTYNIYIDRYRSGHKFHDNKCGCKCYSYLQVKNAESRHYWRNRVLKEHRSLENRHIAI